MQTAHRIQFQCIPWYRISWIGWIQTTIKYRCKAWYYGFNWIELHTASKPRPNMDAKRAIMGSVGSVASKPRPNIDAKRAIMGSVGSVASKPRPNMDAKRAIMGSVGSVASKPRPNIDAKRAIT
eukprot:25599_1